VGGGYGKVADRLEVPSARGNMPGRKTKRRWERALKTDDLGKQTRCGLKKVRGTANGRGAS